MKIKNIIKWTFLASLGLVSISTTSISLIHHLDQELLIAKAATHVENFDEYHYTGSYYSSLSDQLTDGLKGTLFTSLAKLIYPKGFYSYGGDSANSLSEQCQYADEDPTNPNNMIYLYTRVSVKKCYSNGANNWNREHVWPQSNSNGNWGKDKAGTDLLHLRPTYESTNGSRGNLKYGYVSGSTVSYNGMPYGKKGTYFEPLDSVKGDVARIVMYIYVTYRDYYNNLPEITSTFESYDTLLKWHALDKPDMMEGHRNDYCETSRQKNRNPFVDYPDLAYRIFSEKASSSVKQLLLDTYPSSSFGGNSSSSGDSSSSNNSSSSSESSSSSNTSTGGENNKKSGCTASIAGSSIFLFAMSLTGLGIVIKKKKDKKIK